MLDHRNDSVVLIENIILYQSLRKIIIIWLVLMIKKCLFLN